MTDQDAGSLFDVPDYTAWCRALYQRMPLSARTNILFESTIAEPTALLAKLIRRMFGEGHVSDRFQSVFGRGNRLLVEALARRYDVGADQIVTTTGAANAVAITLRAVLAGRGGHVVIENPHLDLIRHLPEAAGASVGTVERRGPHFGIDPADLKRALRPDTRLVIITNPHNPSGAVLPPETLAELAGVLERVGAKLLVDEVYADFALDSIAPAARLAPNLVSVNSLTKVYGLFSLRCGWLIAEPKLARLIEESNARTQFGVSKLTHAIATHVVEEIAPFNRHWRGVLSINRPIIAKAFDAMRADGLLAGELPAFGCMCFPEIVDCSDTRALARRLWSEHEIVVAPGEFFGRAGHVRLGFGLDDGFLEEGLNRLHEVLRAVRRSAPVRARGSGGRP